MQRSDPAIRPCSSPLARFDGDCFDGDCFDGDRRDILLDSAQQFDRINSILLQIPSSDADILWIPRHLAASMVSQIGSRMVPSGGATLPEACISHHGGMQLNSTRHSSPSSVTLCRAMLVANALTYRQLSASRECICFQLNAYLLEAVGRQATDVAVRPRLRLISRRLYIDIHS